jgi:hypothetical protein
LTGVLFLNFSSAQIPALVREWAVYAGNTTDSSFKIPVIIEEGDAIVATFSLDSLSGPDIKIIRYGGESVKGEVKWETTWTGAGNGRDVPTGLFVFEHEIYVCGISWSSTGNYDYVTIKLDDQGGIIWAETYNGSASNYDVASAIAVSSTGVFVTGAANNTGTSLDFTTICYDKSNGSQLWIAHHDFQSLMDIPFSLQLEGSNVIVVGACQETLQAWEYQGIIYEDNGNYYDSYNSSGSSSGFDRALAVCADSTGNVYITGAISTPSEGFNIKTVKIEPGGHVAWEMEHDESGGDDTGYDIMVDEDENVYVCGSVNNDVNGSSDDFYVIKYTGSGQKDWDALIDRENNIDIARALCMDSYGNVIVTGEAYREDQQNMIYRPDFLTIGFTQAGEEIWRDYFGSEDKNDQATDIAADQNGNVYVTGNVGEDQDIQTLTIRYRTDYYTEPASTEPASANYAYYENTGQLIDSEGGGPDYVHYYMPNHYPLLYFQNTSINMAWASIHQDTTVQDSMVRVDMSFYESEYNEKPAQLVENDSSNYINYYLGHCPDGITAYAHEKLLYSNVYPGIDVVFSSNAAGMKMYFMCQPDSDPSNIGLSFTGQDSLAIANNWSLRIETLLGSFDLEKPRVYQQDEYGNVSSLPWQLSWQIQHDTVGRFTNWGTFDTDELLVIELKRALPAGNWPHLWNMEWSTLYGGGRQDIYWDNEIDLNGNIFVSGQNYAGQYPVTPGAFQVQNAGDLDAVISKFNVNCELMFSTYIGGGIAVGNGMPYANEYGRAVMPDRRGSSVYLTGSTSSSDFPHYRSVSSQAYYDVDIYHNPNYGGTYGDIFIAKFNASNGNREWATYYGGDGSDQAFDMDMDSDDNLYIVGTAQFMYTQHTSNSSAYFDDQSKGTIIKFDSDEKLVWASGIGSTVWSIDVDSRGYQCLAGRIDGFNSSIPLDNAADPSFNGSVNDYDAFITVFDGNNEVVWSTYYGGNSYDEATGISFDNDNNVVAVGLTESSNINHLQNSNFPSSYFDDVFNGSGIFGDGFLVKYSSTGAVLQSTYFGGSSNEHVSDVSVDQDNNIFIFGYSSSSNLPVTSTGRFFERPYSGGDMCFLGQFDENVHLEWLTFHNSISSWNTWGLKVNNDKTNNKLVISGTTMVNDPFANFPYVEFNDQVFADHFQNDIPNYFEVENGFIARFDIDWSIWVSDHEISNEGDRLYLFPNPVTESFTVSLPVTNKQNYTVEIFNLMGSKVYSEQIRLEGYQKFHTVGVKGWYSGMYSLVVSDGTESYSTKFIVGN